MDKTKLIYKVLSGEAGEIEKSELERWLADSSTHAEEYEDIKLLYESDQNFEESVNGRDEQFYDGLRNIQIRIDKIKQKRRIIEIVKTFGTSVIISSLVFTITLYQIHLIRQAKFARESLGDTPAILLSDNLVFEDATLRSIFDILESKYHLTIHASNKDLLSCRFSGTFYRGISIDDILRTLAESEDFNLTAKTPRIFELHGDGC